MERRVFLNDYLITLIQFWQSGPNASFSHEGLAIWLFSLPEYPIHSSEWLFSWGAVPDYVGPFGYRPPQYTRTSSEMLISPAILVQCLSPSPLDDKFCEVRTRSAFCCVHCYLLGLQHMADTQIFVDNQINQWRGPSALTLGLHFYISGSWKWWLQVP